MPRLAAALVCLVGLAAPAVAQAQDITGNWDLNVVSDQGNTSTGSVMFKKDGDKIVGTLTAPQGIMPAEATLKGNAVTIWFTVPTREGALNVTMAGTLEGDAMKGTMEIAGREGRREWSAKRAAAPAAGAPAPQAAARLDVTGTWLFTVETGAGTGSPTITLKQDGEKLSGQYSGQLGEAAVSGTLKGSAIEFGFDATLEGSQFHVVYSGTADNASMKGSVKLGDLAEGTFTAKKKS